MPLGPRAILRLNGEGGQDVEDIRSFLASLEQAYNSLCALDNAILHPELLRGSNDLARLIARNPIRERVRALAGSSFLWTPWNAPWSISSLVVSDDRLILRAVQLTSPGFWEFLGKLNPLEVIRLYLQDRHERRKDREYREAAERERLYWENKQHQLGVIDQALDVARRHGASDVELQHLRERFLIGPLNELGTYQERGLISEPSFLEPVGEEHG